MEEVKVREQEEQTLGLCRRTQENAEATILRKYCFLKESEIKLLMIKLNFLLEFIPYGYLRNLYLFY